MEAQNYDLMVKTLQAAPLPALFAILLWFGIFQIWPWFKAKEESRIKADLEYRDSWLKQAAAHTREIQQLREEVRSGMYDLRYDLDAVLMLLAKDRPDLIEFFRHREESRRKVSGG